MKNLTFTTLFLFLIIALTAQKSEKDLNPKDPKAKAILDKMSTKNKAYTSITLYFEYKLENKAEGIDETQKGKGILKGDKYRLELGGQEVICDGKTIWTYLKEAKEVQISEVSPGDENSESLLDPRNFFTLYEKGFKYVKDADTKRNNKDVYSIKLYPEKPASKPFHTVMLYIEKASNDLIAMEVKMKDGNIFTYEITKFEPNVSYADSQFKFITPKGIEEIDLR
jgi:outer membrane lipoprotein-sorting protein